MRGWWAHTDPAPRWFWLAVSIAFGCDSGDAADQALFVGCYELRWNLDSALPPQLVPDAVLLQTDSIGIGERGVVRRRVDRILASDSNRSATGNGPPWHERFYNRWWQNSPADSVKLELMDEGHLLWELWLGAEDSSLVGHARLRSHARGLLTRGRLVAHPRTCVAP